MIRVEEPSWIRALAVIRRKLDPKIIKKDWSGNRYVPATNAIELLNEAFGHFGWEDYPVFESVEGPHEREQKSKTVQEWVYKSTLELECLGVKHAGTGTGTQQWNQADTGYKGAQSSALRKAMQKFGFFMELYPGAVDQPVLWERLNRESGIVKEIKEIAGGKLDEYIEEWAIDRFGHPAVYTREFHLKHFYPPYAKDFWRWLKLTIAKQNNEAKKQESKGINSKDNNQKE